MKKISIDSDSRRLNVSSIVVGYSEENKTEKIEFIIPDKYKEFGKKACFNANGKIFAKIFDDINGSTLTFTRDITKYKELEMSIEFFKIENEDEIIARTSNLHIIIENSVICDDDISPDEPKIIILDKLIDDVTKVGLEVEKKGNYAKEQGDYAKSQAENVIIANTEAIKIINNFETNVGEYTTAFNENANNKTIDFDSNAQNKTSDFNQNVDNKISEYNNNASEKLIAYNTNATSKLNDYNTNADNKIAEYDLHSQELDNKIIDTRNELERVKNDVLETGTDTDTFVHLEDSAMAEYQELSVDGVCEQQTISGKNLLPRTTKTIQTVNGITFTINEDGTIKANGTASNKATLYLENNTTLPSGTYTISSGLNGVSGVRFGLETKSKYLNTNTNRTDTFSEETIIRNSYFQIDSGVTVNNLVLKPMVRLASITDDTYEPYTGGQPSPNPDYPQPISTIENSLKITSCNKNLFDKDNENMFLKDLTLDNNGKCISVTTDLTRQHYIRTIILKCKPNTTYSIQKLSSKTFYVYDSDVVPTLDYQTRLIHRDAIANNLSFTTSNNANYILFKFFNTWSNETYTYDEIVSSIQIEENTQATSYEQHLETQIQANLPEGEFIGKINDTYKDTLKVEYNETDGQYHLKLYKRVYKNNSYNGESYNYYISTTARKDGNIECGELQTGQVVYYLGDETIIDLGVVDMPITYNEITNLFTDSDLIPIINAKYYRNFISTVRNLQVNEKALKQELIDINARLSALESANASVMSESEVIE